MGKWGEGERGGSKIKVWEVVQESRGGLKGGNRLEGAEEMEPGKPGVGEARRCQGGWKQDRKGRPTQKPYLSDSVGTSTNMEVNGTTKGGLSRLYCQEG